MKRIYGACVFLCLTTFLLSQSNPVPRTNQSAKVVPPIGASQADPKAQPRILDRYGRLPLSFEANHGEADARVKFLSRTGGYTLFLTGDEAVLVLRGKERNTPQTKIASTAHTLPSSMAASKAGGALRMKLRNANPAAKVTGADELPGTSNYFIGNDPAKWRTNVRTYAKVKYEGIYPGIDLVYYGKQRQLEYDFVVAPGADPRRIRFEVRGAKRIRREGNGELMFKVGEEEIRWHKPVVYQEKDGRRQEVAGHYALTGTNRVGFEVAKYDASRPLYIDPLIYSTYLGGSGPDDGWGIAADSAGNAYISGSTESIDFPTVNPLQPTLSGHGDAFVAKINPAGSALVYSTYLGGSLWNGAEGIAVDGAGNAYVTGQTTSTDFPTTPGAFQTVCNGGSNCDSDGDAFVAKLNPEGSALVYSTYLGGSNFDVGEGIAVDSAGNAYVSGVTDSADFPTTPGAFQTVCNGGSDCFPNGDAFVTKLNCTGTALVYSSFLGGSWEDLGVGIALDSADNAYVTGGTGSTDFPTVNPLQGTNGGGYFDAFVAKINAAGSALVYSTYLGGSLDDYGTGIAVDGAGNAYITGETTSANFPTMNPLQPANGGGTGGDDAFVAKINAAGSALVYSTYLGGAGAEQGNGIAVDSAGNAYVAGISFSTNFPIVNALQKRKKGETDVFLSKLNATGSGFFYSTYLGGGGRFANTSGASVAVDNAGNVYIAGSTSSTQFPTMNPLQPSNAGGGDAFVAKIDVAAATTTALSSSPNPSIYGQLVTFTAVVNSSAGAPPDEETVSFMKGKTILGTVTLSGGSATFMTSTLAVGTKAVTAVYGGDSNFAGSKSKAVSQVISKATTTTTLVSSLNPSKVGRSVTFTATVTPEFSGTPTGTVAFYDGTTLLKSVTLNVTPSGSEAQFTTSTLISGTHTITATYKGSTTFTASTSQAVTQVVNVATGPYGVVNPAALNFGQVVVGQTSPQKLVGLSNVGSSELIVSNVSISGDFAIAKNTCANGVKPATHCNVYVTFTPHAVGAKSGSLIFLDNASNSPQTVSLTGTGTN
jgi:Bacterial Ig-like domain (group 3)/Beta-propeller repeat